MSRNKPVTTVNMHEAKSSLSRLVEKAVNGEKVVIAKAGKPLATLVAFTAEPPLKKKRIGFLADARFVVPSAGAFNALGRDEIEAMFGGE